jgi:hypothetical protein
MRNRASRILVGAAGFEPTASLEFNQGALTAELHAYFFAHLKSMAFSLWFGLTFATINPLNSIPDSAYTTSRASRSSGQFLELETPGDPEPLFRATSGKS